MGDSQTVAEPLLCVAGYGYLPTRGDWTERLSRLCSLVCELSGEAYSHAWYFDGPQRIDHPIAEGLPCAFPSAVSGRGIDYAIACRFVPGYLMNSYKVTQTAAATTQSLRDDYPRTYASLSNAVFPSLASRLSAVNRIFQAMRYVNEIHYGLATLRPMDEGPTAYFLDDGQGRKTSRADKANINAWLAGLPERSTRVRGTYGANVLSTGHLAKLGGIDKAWTLLTERVPGVALTQLGEGLLCIHAWEEPSRLALEELFSERDLLMIAPAKPQRTRRRRAAGKETPGPGAG